MDSLSDVRGRLLESNSRIPVLSKDRASASGVANGFVTVSSQADYFNGAVVGTGSGASIW